jgi:hypothetical protein
MQVDNDFFPHEPGQESTLTPHEPLSTVSRYQKNHYLNFFLRKYLTSSLMYDKKSSMKDFDMTIIYYEGMKANKKDFCLHFRRFEVTRVCFCGVFFHKKYYNAFFNKFQDKKNTRNNFLLFLAANTREGARRRREVGSKK